MMRTRKLLSAKATGRLVGLVAALAFVVALAVVGRVGPVGTGHAQTLAQHLVARVVPSTIPADGQQHQALFLRLELDDGLPVAPKSDVVVSLFSSNTDVASVPASVTLTPQQPAAAVPVTSGHVPGTARLQAVSSGFGGATVDLTATSPSGATPPYQLGLDLAPAALAAGSEMPGYVVVELLGGKGIPLAAPQDVVVTLTSSQPRVATMDSKIVIPQGEYFAVAQVRAGEKGDSTIAAQADGFQAASKLLKVAAAAVSPSKLAMYAIPSTGLTGHRRPYTILVQAVDASDAPTVYPCTDTNLAVGDRGMGAFTTPFITIPEGYACGATAAYGTATFEPGASGANGAVFASANGVNPATLQVKSLGVTPQRAVASFAFPSLVHGDTPYNFLVVQFQDLGGIPARATSDLQVFLRGSELRLPAEISAPAGASEVTVPALVGSAGATGTALVVVRGLPDTQVSVNIVKVNVDVKLEARPATLLLGQETRVQARVTLNELPVSGVPIQWSTQGGEILSATQVTGDDGIATLVFRPTDLDPTQVTAQAIRFGATAGTASVTLQALPAASARRPAPSLSFLGVRIPVLWLAVLVGLVLVVYLFVSYGWAGRLARALGGQQSAGAQPPSSPTTPRAGLGDVLRRLVRPLRRIPGLLRRGR